MSVFLSTIKTLKKVNDIKFTELSFGARLNVYQNPSRNGNVKPVKKIIAVENQLEFFCQCVGL